MDSYSARRSSDLDDKLYGTISGNMAVITYQPRQVSVSLPTSLK